MISQPPTDGLASQPLIAMARSVRRYRLPHCSKPLARGLFAGAVTGLLDFDIGAFQAPKRGIVSCSDLYSIVLNGDKANEFPKAMARMFFRLLKQCRSSSICTSMLRTSGKPGLERENPVLSVR